MQVFDRYEEPPTTRELNCINFSTVSSDQALRTSFAECINHTSWWVEASKRTRVKNGALDGRLGTSNTRNLCDTCNQSMLTCPGHFGHVNLVYPCYHPGYQHKVLQLLHCICKNCCSLLLEKEIQMRFRISLSRNISFKTFKRIVRAAADKARKSSACHNCGHPTGTIKRINSIKYVWDFTKSAKVLMFNISECKKELTPSDVYRFFCRIDPSDYMILGFINGNSPLDTIITKIPVPPASIRPSVISDERDGTNEDDLTVKISEIVYKSRYISELIASNGDAGAIFSEWEGLQFLLFLYIKGEAKGVPYSLNTGKSIRSLVKRLKGKHGRFRNNLSGKRADFTARTVISPDPNVPINTVVVPVDIAKTLTVVERVNRYNIDWIRERMKNGPNIHPGVKAVHFKKQGLTKALLPTIDFTPLIKQISIGDEVVRHLADNDIVLFNRQPSLHRLSIMAHKVKVQPEKTLRFNECVCTPYNADFDGDEMNIHLPQTIEARAEAYCLMNVLNNITTPRNGDPLIAATQDFITGSFLLTYKDTFINYETFSLLVSSFLILTDQTTYLDIPPPAIFKPYRLWTGKQVISCMLSPNPKQKTCINLRTPGKSYSRKNDELCCNDSYVVIYNGEHLSGSLDKSTVGSGSKNTIFYSILREYNASKCAEVMLRLNRVTSLYLMIRGFSIGLNDVQPSYKLSMLFENLVMEGYERCEKFSEDAHNNLLPVQPGCTMEETLESCHLKELSKIRSSIGELCIKEIDHTSSPLVMALCGSKGSTLNISQMIGCVGQQAITGKRILNGFEGRPIPVFPKNSSSPASKGFVRNGFYSGMTPYESFFHAMAGRDGLVDTAVKTAETGYMQRRLVKCLEDLCIQYDNTVRNSASQVIQFLYGGDGLDPIEMEGLNQPVNFNHLFNHIKSKFFSTSEPFITPEEISERINHFIESESTPGQKYFLKNISLFFESTNTKCITQKMFDEFMRASIHKYRRAKIEPGTTVGAICAQSIGEPATQMTLKTFHFAGVSAMNITLGVPRLKELVNATLHISTPIITVPIDIKDDIDYCNCVKGRIEKTTLGSICIGIHEVCAPNELFIEIVLNLALIKSKRLEITADTVVTALTENRKIKVVPSQITVVKRSRIRVQPRPLKNLSLYYSMIQLKTQLPDVVVKGYPSITRVLIHDSGDGQRSNYQLLVEGDGLSEVLGTKSVCSKFVRSNNPKVVQYTLGIEAARVTVINEISYAVKQYDINVDIRHFELLADYMTSTGDLHGFTRHGLSKTKDSPLLLASFEQTTDHLYDAASHSVTEHLNGVSESIIVGAPMKVGTGMFQLFYKPDDSLKPQKRRMSILEKTFNSKHPRQSKNVN